MELFSNPFRWIWVALIFLLFLYTLILLRSNKLNTQHAVSWVVTELAALILLTFDPASMWIVQLIGSNNILSTVFLLGFIWIVTLMLDLLVRLSEMSAKLRNVIEELALLTERLEALDERTDTASSEVQQGKGMLSKRTK